MNQVRRRFLVEGRVQGVSFRAATRARARELGLRGWARNLPDGRVEVVAGGSAAGVGELELWLQDGPPAARVTNVRPERFDGEPGDDFSVR
ncbi:MAG TPA: acylphosphatase [Gammaproteobacteria bacterium]|nr:acylphosphatase [Gammaproteobacteria bacterium]